MMEGIFLCARRRGHALRAATIAVVSSASGGFTLGSDVALLRFVASTFETRLLLFSLSTLAALSFLRCLRTRKVLAATILFGFLVLIYTILHYLLANIPGRGITAGAEDLLAKLGASLACLSLLRWALLRRIDGLVIGELGIFVVSERGGKNKSGLMIKSWNSKNKAISEKHSIQVEADQVKFINLRHLLYEINCLKNQGNGKNRT